MLRAPPRPLLILLVLLLGGASATAQPATVYVYNHRPGDTFDGNAEALIFQLLGLLDENGAPIDIPENQTIRDGSNNIIGYRNADGTAEAYNVNSSASTDHAWQQVATGGELHIIKHGMKYEVNTITGNPPATCGNGTVDAGEACDPPGGQAQCGVGICGPFCQCCGDSMVDDGEACDPPGAQSQCAAGQTCFDCQCEGRGGAIRLDNGTLFDGFGNGTGVGYNQSGGMAYPLTPRPGLNATINANSCWSSNDPDGAGNETSVTDSAMGVPGVSDTEGHDVAVYIHCQVGLTGGTPAQRAAALAALRPKARAAGFPPAPGGGAPRPATTNAHIGAWICSLPFGMRHGPVQDCIDGEVEPAGTVTLTLNYVKNETPTPGGAIGGGSGVCANLSQSQAGSFSHVKIPFDDYVPAFLETRSSSLDDPAVILSNQLGEAPAAAPAGQAFASGIFEFENLGYGSLVDSVRIRIGFDLGAQDPVLRRFDPQLGQWVAPSGSIAIDTQAGNALINTTELGVFAVLGDVPFAPATSPAWLALTALALVAAAWVAHRRRARLEAP